MCSQKTCQFANDFVHFKSLAMEMFLIMLTQYHFVCFVSYHRFVALPRPKWNISMSALRMVLVEHKCMAITIWMEQCNYCLFILRSKLDYARWPLWHWSNSWCEHYGLNGKQRKCGQMPHHRRLCLTFSVNSRCTFCAQNIAIVFARLNSTEDSITERTTILYCYKIWWLIIFASEKLFYTDCKTNERW